jgi:hypothetical protein
MRRDAFRTIHQHIGRAIKLARSEGAADSGRCRPRLLSFPAHGGAEFSLVLIAPVGGPEFEEDGGVGNRHVRFNNEDAEITAYLTELGNDLVVQHRLLSAASEQGCQLLPIGGDSGCILVVHELKLFVDVDDGPDVLGSRDAGENLLYYVDLICTGNDRFDAAAGLSRISGIGDDDPVSMAVESKPLLKYILPVRSGIGASARSTQRNSSEENG